MILGLICAGILVGVISGLVGIGGGLFLVPLLHYGFKLGQHEAQGTSIAVLVPPIGIFAALEYYRRGFVRLPIVAYIAVGFAIGAFLGAALAGNLPAAALRRLFGLLMFAVSLQVIFASGQPTLRALLPTGVATIAVGVLAWTERRLSLRTQVRARLESWLRRRHAERQADDDVEYHI
jgi:uncharacterized membrane protein YfcA